MSFGSFFFRKPKVHVFLRACYYSQASAHKKRLQGFSHQRCFRNLTQTLDSKKASLTILLDTAYRENERHYVLLQKSFPVIEISEGTEAGSFLRLLDYVETLSLDEEAILYFVEDDYLHRPLWVDALLEGFSLPGISYITLYDHRDKYLLSLYPFLTAWLFQTSLTHWRTTPSTTNTYAMRCKTLKEHMQIHRAFSLNRKITADHEKFCALAETGALLISPIPGWSTHMDCEFLSPCIDWKKEMEEKLSEN